MSATLKNIYGASPGTTRGKPVHIGGDPKGNNFVYTCGSSVFMRNLKNPLKCEMYTEHQHPTTVARYAPSGFYIASGDISGTVRIWDTTQKEHILKIELRVLGGPILDLQWSDDSKRIVAVGEGKDKFGAVFLWDSGSSVGEITGHTKPITSCDFKQTRPYRLITGSEDFQANWFEGPPFKFKKTFKEHTRFVNCVRFSPDGSKVCTVGSDKAGFIYEGKEGNAICPLSSTNGHSAGIYSCSWSPDSKRLLTASADKTCKVWNGENGECQNTFIVSDNPQTEDQQLGCLWQGDEMISVSLSGDIIYHDPSNPKKPKRILRGHNKFITGLAYDAASKHMYTGSYDGLIVRWDVESGETEGLLGKGHTNQIKSMFIQGDNIVTCAMDDTVRITSTKTRQYSGEGIKLDSTPQSICVGQKNKSLIIAATLDAVVVIKDGKVASKRPAKFQPTCVALSVDETQVAVGGKDNIIHLYNLSGTELSEGKTLTGHRGALTCIRYSPDGQHMASADHNRDIFVWDKSGSIKVQGWVFHTASVNCLAWAPDSVHIVSGSLDNNIIVWDVQKPDKRIIVKDAHRGGVNAVAFLDATTVASTGQDCTVKTWTIAFHKP